MIKNTKYKLNRECLVDPFKSGRKKLANVKDERRRERQEYQKKVSMIHESVQYFLDKRKRDRAKLDSMNESLSTSRENTVYAKWEDKMIEAMKKFDMNEYYKC